MKEGRIFAIPFIQQNTGINALKFDAQ